MEIIDYSRSRLARLIGTLVAVPDRPAVFSIEGTGAAECLQGIFTNDVRKPAPGSLIYGAFLTPKGGIVFDGWVVKTADRFLVVFDGAARERAAEIFRRQLPPRLARAVDRSESAGVVWLLGPLNRAGPPVPFDAWPAAGRIDVAEAGLEPLWLARGPATAAFAALLLGPPDRLATPGFEPGSRADLRASRVLAGVPTLGAEIDERTFPQEVDFDRLEGVSYSKGCYVGQETVARIHFRGHPNWTLRGVRAAAGFESADQRSKDGKPSLHLKTMLRLEDGTGIGLGSARREIGAGETLDEGAGKVTVVDLPQHP